MIRINGKKKGLIYTENGPLWVTADNLHSCVVVGVMAFLRPSRDYTHLKDPDTSMGNVCVRVVPSPNVVDLKQPTYVGGTMYLDMCRQNVA